MQQVWIKTFQGRMQSWLASLKDPFSCCGANNPTLWSIVGTSAGALDTDTAFWWRKAGYPFAVLLEKAGYSYDSQRRNLLFFFFVVLPELGPGPDFDGRSPPWQSFMTDHFSPVELSWEWGLNGKPPLVRFSIEPIGMFAGTCADPLNEFAALRMVHGYQPLIPGCDLQWFSHFMQLVSFSTAPDQGNSISKLQSHKSRLFVAFDVFEESVMLKAYFLPASRAAETGRPVRKIVSDAVSSLPEYQSSALTAFDTLTEFLDSTAIGATLIPEIVAIDCIQPASSRIKIYMRSQCTSFRSVCQIMGLSDLIETESSRVTEMKQLKFLWYTVLGLDTSFPEDKELPTQTHRTAGILYYFEIRPGKWIPNSKVYIPVRHYGLNDRAIADGISKYQTWRDPGSPTEQYNEVLRCISTRKKLRNGLGLQTYIGCSFVNSELKIISYLAPKVFMEPKARQYGSG